MLQNLLIEEILNSRKTLIPKNGIKIFNREQAAEGGCGVIGIACSEQIAGRHLLQSLIQMRNRGNGKGGGIAAVGLSAEEFGVDQQILDEDYLLTIAYLDPKIRSEVERECITPTFMVDHVREQPQIQNHLSIDGFPTARFAERVAGQRHMAALSKPQHCDHSGRRLRRGRHPGPLP